MSSRASWCGSRCAMWCICVRRVGASYIQNAWTACRIRMALPLLKEKECWFYLRLHVTIASHWCHQLLLNRYTCDHKSHMRVLCKTWRIRALVPEVVKMYTYVIVSCTGIYVWDVWNWCMRWKCCSSIPCKTHYLSIRERYNAIS